MSKYSVEICKIINEANQHHTAESIYNLLKKENSKIVLASVYNNLNTLVLEGKIRRFSVNGIYYYDKLVPHAHLICDYCGSVQDVFVNKDLLKEFQETVESNIDYYELKLHFICQKCRKGIE